MYNVFLAFAVIATVRIAGLEESSGLAASRKHPGVFWTMNDGPAPYLYAFDRLGKRRARVRIPRVAVHDWEGLALGPGPVRGRSYLYIGDIGDNRRRRKNIVVYRIEEPDLQATVAKPAQAIRLTYPDGAHDAEALMIHPKTGDLYIAIKSNNKDAVYKAAAPLNAKSITRMKRIAELRLPAGSLLTRFVGRVTGGDISPDGSRVVLCDYSSGWEAVAPGDNFDDVWKAQWRSVGLGDRAQGEAVAYSHDGEAILATSEGSEFRLIESRLAK